MANKTNRIPFTFYLKLPRAASTVSALVLREMATSYGRSPGGYLWAIAEPVAGIALLTMVFSLGFHAPPLGTSFALFYATGLLPFLLYSDLNGKLSQAINFSLPLLSYPRVTLIDAILARACLNIGTQILVCCAVLGGLASFIDIQARLDLARLIQAVSCAFLLGFGIGSLNCFLVTRFPVWQRAWSIANRPLFLLSCIVFTFESVPSPFRDWLWFNPIVHVVGMMRQAMYFGYSAEYVSVSYVVFVSLLTSVSGFFAIWRYKDVLLNR